MKPVIDTIDPNEVAKFEAMADEWWDPDGKFKPLHMLNPCRLDYIVSQIALEFDRDLKSKKPFKGLEILDIGCGGGLLCEPMARLGATVVGVDAAERNIPVAKAHANRSNLSIDYKVGTAEELAESGSKFDVILNMEVVEHVNDIDLFISKTAKLLKNDGIMFIATINKTLKSYVMAIVGAEYILRWLPIGTHDWNQFVEPDKLINIGKKNSLFLNKIEGVKFNLLKNKFRLSTDKSVNYIAEFYKS